MAGDERSERGGAADAAASSSDALLIVGEADEITWANDAAHSLLGVAELVDTDLNRLLEFRAGQGLGNLRGRTPQRALGTLVGRDDERVPAEIGLAPLQDKAGQWVVTILPLPRSQLSVRELLRRANEDRLTTLVNRSYFIESVEATFRDPATVDFPYALAMLDLDGFKRINDELGHAAGDDLLRHVSTVMRETADHTDLVARLGGDEFAVILDSGDVQQLFEIMHRLIDRIALVGWDWRGGALHVTASAGIARSNTDESWSDADAALYLAKAEGKNRVIVHDPEDARLVAREADQRLARETRDGLAQGRFILYGQPIVRTDDRDDHPMLVESLLRYVGDDGRHHTPARYIYAAGQYGLTERLDRWVIETAVGWLAANPQAPPMSINVHPNTVVFGDIVRHLGTVLGHKGVEPDRVIIEITEDAAIRDEPRCREVVKNLRNWGTRVAFDDFGSGWTSLSVARDVEVDFLKIDGAWVRDATIDQLSRQVVEAIAATAHTLGARTVAEWVENDSTRDFLSELGIDFVQGFLTGRPEPLDASR